VKGILDNPDEVLSVLFEDGFAVAFARMAQDDTENMSSTFLAVLDNPGTRSEVDLGLMAGFAFHTTKG